ncbi:MAG TPA: hypothetical protein VMV41_13080 [Cellulomonadaceae bacterium]|nr:hypothetical protein [Cellulomonadaceae bacterium]
MSLSRHTMAFLGIGFIGVASIGVGVGATFTDATHSVQTITAGTLDVTLSSPDATSGNNTKTLTLADFGPTASTFKTPASIITITNNGTVKANEVWIGVGNAGPAAAADAAMWSQLSLCIYSPPSLNGGVGGVVFNGLVSTLQAMNSGKGQQVAGYVGPNGPPTDAYTAEFYAGLNTTSCGNASYGGTYATPPSLTDAAQGGVVTPTVTIQYEG